MSGNGADWRWGESNPCPQPSPKLGYKIHSHPHPGLHSNRSQTN